MAKKSNGGRPTVFTQEVLQKLEYAFSLGCTDLEACFYADISKSSLYNYQNENPEFLERKESLKERPVLLAREQVVNAIIGGDVASAHKVLDRKEGSKVSIDANLTVSTVERRIVDPADTDSESV
jgi:hypothetical protein